MLGPMGRLVVAISVIVLSLAAPSAQATIIIDTFDNTIQQVQSPAGANPSSSTVATADAIQGFRTMTISRTAGTGTVRGDTNNTDPNSLSYQSPLGNTGTLTVLWDRNGLGLVPVDLTQAGLNTTFALAVASDLGASLTLTVTSASGSSSATVGIPISPATLVPILVPFASFVGAANFTSATSIQLFINGSNPAVDVTIDYLFANAAPEPATIGLMAFGTLGLILARRRLHRA